MTRRFAQAQPRRIPGHMNKTEQAYADHLFIRKLAGEIIHFSFEPEKFRLADLTTYCPDFRVIMPDMTIEFHEVKGSWKAPHQEDARVKIKVCAEQHWMYRFVSASSQTRKRGGGWDFEYF